MWTFVKENVIIFWYKKRAEKRRMPGNNFLGEMIKCLI